MDVTDLFWAAWRNPETFDSYLASTKVDSHASRCLRELGDKALQASRDERQRCAQMVSYTPSWNECHDEADRLNDQGVILTDIARTVDGQTRFSVSDGGRYLIGYKALIGAADWTQVVDQVRAATGRLKCEW